MVLAVVSTPSTFIWQALAVIIIWTTLSMEMDFRMISSQSAWPCRSPIKLRRCCDPCDLNPLRVSEVSMTSRWNTFWKEDPLEWEPTFDHQFKSCDLLFAKKNFPQWTKNVTGQTKHQQKDASWIRFQASIPLEKNPNSRNTWSFQGAPKKSPYRTAKMARRFFCNQNVSWPEASWMRFVRFQDSRGAKFEFSMKCCS